MDKRIVKENNITKRWDVFSLLLFFIFVGLTAEVSYSQNVENEKKATLTITHVSEDHFISKRGQFWVDDQTEVYGLKGEKSDIKYFQLPCKAVVTYKQIDKNHFLAVQVRVTKVISPPVIPE